MTGSSNSPPNYPRSHVALVDAWSVAICWLLLALLALSSIVLKIWPELPGAALAANFVAFVGAMLVHLVLSLLHACPSCGKHPTVQGFKAVHPNSVGQSVFTGWGGAVVNILRRRRLICIHCGSEYRIDMKG